MPTWAGTPMNSAWFVPANVFFVITASSSANMSLIVTSASGYALARA